MTCVLDVLQHLPHSTLSNSQLEVILWAIQVLGVPDVPSVASMKEVQKMLDAVCGVRTLQYHGALGHIYYTNSLEDIVSREMANPYVCSRLSFYPLDANGWIKRTNTNLSGRNELVGLTWKIYPHGDGWVVASTEQHAIPISEFGASFFTLKQSYKARSIPDLGNIVVT
ncbi:hypothetical protein GYMLUDRAFT_59756 [Collybiopsis luxurians FD-317 M1]|uniref:Uncharacterized protein n=1 Tax=Collybiopsis luxurians FD-317 M1 TaxID=944289 RepID=A0A0D0CC23_9AGAR|nr:hypothetical protein GYMLUDRAFT_59756 [Collybiopsis luxurians FD-317 M1]